MKTYQYSSLMQARQIRLLKLYAGAEADELSAELVHVSLDGVPSFIALSYAWGKSQPRKGICCSGLKLEIGPSLHSALQHLRQSTRETYLWADALCINQKDILERSQQVRIMSDIYAAAFNTVIWLGEESSEVKAAFGWLRRFAMARDKLESDLPASSDDLGFINSDRAERVLQAAFGRNRASAFQHIWALLSRSWFTRKWVIQELVKSQMPLMVAGRISLPWALLADWISYIEACPNLKEVFMRYCPEPLEAGAKAIGISMLRVALLTQIAVPEKQMLLSLIVKTLEFKCADPRDHVFALVGIASDANHFDLIDYGSPIEKVCRELACACISDSRSLKMLWSLVYLAPMKRRVRSWVPNIESVLEDGDGSILATQFSVQQHKYYKASGDTVLKTHLNDGGNLLMIRGRIVDRLRVLGSDNRSLGNAGTILKNILNRDIYPIHKNLQKMFRRRCQWLEECLTITRTANTANVEEAFRNALLDDLLLGPLVPQSRLGVASNGFFTHIRHYKTMAYEKDFNTWLSTMITSMSLESSHLLESIIMEKLQRRFGCTENGLIGWLPTIAEEGDFICVLDGMELLYVIRPAANGRYLLVGECIIPGLMMGEAVELSCVFSEMIALE